MAPRHLRHRSRRGDARQADGGRQADPGLPSARPPDGRPRPAALEGAVDPARARPRHLRPHDLGPRPRVPHRRRRRCRQDASRRPARRAARCVLPHDRRRVHAHPEHRRAAVDPGAVRGSPARDVQGAQAPDPRTAERGRELREVPRHEVRRHEAVRDRGSRVGDPDPRLRAVACRRRRVRRCRAGHGAPWPSQRAVEHHGQELRGDLLRVRGAHRPVVGAGLR